MCTIRIKHDLTSQGGQGKDFYCILTLSRKEGSSRKLLRFDDIPSCSCVATFSALRSDSVMFYLFMFEKSREKQEEIHFA